jgi:hypothetical protein
MGKIFKTIATGAEATADLAKMMAKFGKKAASEMATAVKNAIGKSKSLVGTATDMAKSLKRVDGGNLSDAFETMAKKGDMFDDGFKAVIENAQKAAKRAEDAAAAAATAGKKGLLGTAAGAAATGVKKIADACTSSAKAGAVCAATAGTAVYAGLWWKEETAQGRRRTACRSMCMPANTDDFVGTAFSEVGKDNLTFKTLEDVQEFFPEATSNTLPDYPVCLDTDEINTLADCEEKCNTECSNAHPKSDFFESFGEDVARAGVAVGQGVGSAAGAALGGAAAGVADASGLGDFWKKYKLIILTVMAVVVLGALAAIISPAFKRKSGIMGIEGGQTFYRGSGAGTYL